MYNDKYTHIEILCQQKPIVYNLKTLECSITFFILIVSVLAPILL